MTSVTAVTSSTTAFMKAAIVFVVLIDLAGSLSCPTNTSNVDADLTTFPVNQIAFVNQSATLSLRSNESGFWHEKSSSGGLVSLRCFCVEVQPNNFTYQLYINSTTPQDAHTYVFNFITKFATPLEFSLALLDVLLTVNTSHGQLVENDNVSVICALLVYNNAVNIIVDVDIDNSFKRQINVTSAGPSRLNLPAVILPAKAQYNCTASFFCGETFTKTFTSRLDLQYSVKTVTVNVTDQRTLRVGDVLTCSADANPPAIITWQQLMDDKWVNIRNGSNFVITAINDMTFLCNASSTIRGQVSFKLSATIQLRLYNNTTGVISTNLTNSSVPMPPASMTDSGDSHLAIGLGVGIGVGLAIVVLVVVVVVFACRKSRRNAPVITTPPEKNKHGPARQSGDDVDSLSHDKRTSMHNSLTVIDNNLYAGQADDATASTRHNALLRPPVDNSNALVYDEIRASMINSILTGNGHVTKAGSPQPELTEDGYLDVPSGDGNLSESHTDLTLVDNTIYSNSAALSSTSSLAAPSFRGGAVPVESPYAEVDVVGVASKI